MSRSDPETSPPGGWIGEQSLVDLYRDEAPWLIRFFRRQLGNTDDAQDLAQEAMVRFIKAAPVTQAATPQAYLRRIAANLLKDRFKSSATKMARLALPLNDDLDAAADYDPHRELSGRQELSDWENILARLKPVTREIFLMSRIDGYSYKEIAAELDMTMTSVKKQMVKAIAHVERHRRRR